MDGFRIGSLESGSIRAGVSDLSCLAGVRIDAIVGLDVLARSNFIIDYGSRVLRYVSNGQDDLVVPMEIVWPFVTVRMRIAGEQARFLVDTGSGDLVLFKTRMSAALSRPPWKGDKTVQYASGPARLLRSSCDRSLWVAYVGQVGGMAARPCARRIPHGHRWCARCAGSRLQGSAVRLRAR